jgi:hypothetical protein
MNIISQLYAEWSNKKFSKNSRNVRNAHCLKLPDHDVVVELCHYRMSHVLAFYVKCYSKEFQGIFQEIYNNLDEVKDHILEKEKEKEKQDGHIRIHFEVIRQIQGEPIDFYQVGIPFHNAIVSNKGWTTNESKSFAFYGKTNFLIEFNIFDEGNMSEIPNYVSLETYSAHTNQNLLELREIIRTNDLIRSYSIGTFNDVPEEQEFETLIADMIQASSTITCQLVYGIPVLL